MHMHTCTYMSCIVQYSTLLYLSMIFILYSNIFIQSGWGDWYGLTHLILFIFVKIVVTPEHVITVSFLWRFCIDSRCATTFVTERVSGRRCVSCYEYGVDLMHADITVQHDREQTIPAPEVGTVRCVQYCTVAGFNQAPGIETEMWYSTSSYISYR